MQNFIDLLEISNDLYHFIRNNFLNSKKKWLFLYIILHIENVSSAIIRLITSKKKGITYALMRLWNKKTKKKWVQLNVISAIPLNNTIEVYLLKFFQKSNKNRKFFFEKKVNNSIIGGLILRINDKEWDSSLEELIRKLRIHLKCDLST